MPKFHNCFLLHGLTLYLLQDGEQVAVRVDGLDPSLVRIPEVRFIEQCPWMHHEAVYEFTLKLDKRLQDDHKLPAMRIHHMIILQLN